LPVFLSVAAMVAVVEKGRARFIVAGKVCAMLRSRAAAEIIKSY
jgi:hypothetical protein